MEVPWTLNVVIDITVLYFMVNESDWSWQQDRQLLKQIKYIGQNVYEKFIIVLITILNVLAQIPMEVKCLQQTILPI